MMRRSIALLTALAVTTGASPLWAADASIASGRTPPPSAFALSLVGGTDGSPLGHLGVRFSYEHGRLEVSGGLGVFFGANFVDFQSERYAGLGPTERTHIIPWVGVHYAVLRRSSFDLFPGLVLSRQPFAYEEDVTRPSYDTVRFVWSSSSALRLNAELGARLSFGSWFVGGLAGWGVFIAGMGNCSGQTPVFGFPCGQPPSPAYTPPTPIAGVPYGQLFAGRRF